MNRAPEEDTPSPVTQADDPGADHPQGDRLYPRTSNVQLAFGDTATKLSAIAGILIQRPKHMDLGQSDLPSWATSDSKSFTSHRPSVFSSAAAAFSRQQTRGGDLDTPDDSSKQITGQELREILFVSKREKSILQGLKADTITRQTVVTSLSLGLAIGSVVAILCKIFRDVALNMWP